jgi:hypothetical protein
VKTGRLIWLAPIFLLLAPCVVFPQSGVDARLQKLEETSQVLERRVATLEDQLREQNAPARVAPDKVNWRKLRKGMSEDEVEQLLGSPSRVDVFGVIAIWHYGDASRGQVRFDADKHTVDAWSEP